MSCVCTKTKPLNNCGDYLGLPTSDSTVTNVEIYFKRLSDGRITRVTVELTGGVGGFPRIAFADLPYFSDDDAYEVWHTELDKDMEERLNFVISATNYTCLQLQFKDVYLTSGLRYSQSVDQQTVELQ